LNKFDKNSNNCVVIMYPAGGYGNFLYYLLTEFFEDTVKTDNKDFLFSISGDSHKAKKYTEIFSLGLAHSTKTLQSFNYNYQINDKDAYAQIKRGKKFLVLADTGNLGDNVNFVRRYFTSAKILRVYANTFNEKLIVWNNCLKKAYTNHNDPIYKDSVHTVSGLAKFFNKDPSTITDSDAIECALAFFKQDFEQYGKFYSTPVEKTGVINFPVYNFFEKSQLLNSLESLSVQLDTSIIEKQRLSDTVDKFLQTQLFKFQPDSIVGQALQRM
jgi:hypothetical protein